MPVKRPQRRRSALVRSPAIAAGDRSGQRSSKRWSPSYVARCGSSRSCAPTRRRTARAALRRVVGAAGCGRQRQAAPDRMQGRRAATYVERCGWRVDLSAASDWHSARRESRMLSSQAGPWQAMRVTTSQCPTGRREVTSRHPSQGPSGEWPATTAEGATRPETLRQTNGERLMGSGERPAQAAHRRGEVPAHRRPISQVTRTEGRRVAGAACRLFLPRCREAGPTAWVCAHLSTTRTSPPAPAWSISAAGTCRSTTARRSRSTTRCGAMPACSTCRTCASSTCAATGRATTCAGCSRTTSRSSTSHGKALYSCMLQRATAA